MKRKKMRVPLKELLQALSAALDFVEQELLGVTTNHGKRAAYVSAAVCGELGLAREDIFDMASCAILHDNALTAYMLQAGPGGIGRLEHFRGHCTRGEENAMAFPFAGDARGIILHHHENWDGTGFHSLAGEDIPLRAAILRLADNMDLEPRMGDGRGGLKEAIRGHALKHSGRLYAPQTVQALLRVLTDEFVQGLADEQIDRALNRVIPQIRVDLSTEQMLRICGMFSFIIDAKSHFTRNHSWGIADSAAKLAAIYGIEGEHRDKIVIAAYLHDLGKLSTPLNILEKPGPLTDEEFAVMRNHAAVTRQILGRVNGLEEITDWSSKHHEKLNGRGYPTGCGEKELSFECRLLTCCDIYQALTEDRPYRPGMPHAKAMGIMREMVDNREIDPEITRTIDEKLTPPIFSEQRNGRRAEAEGAYQAAPES